MNHIIDNLDRETLELAYKIHTTKNIYSDDSDSDHSLISESELERLRPPPFSLEQIQKNLVVIKSDGTIGPCTESSFSPLITIADNLSKMIMTNVCQICNKISKGNDHYKVSKHANGVLKWLKEELSKFNLYNEDSICLIYCIICNLPLKGNKDSKSHYEQENHKQNIPKYCLYCFCEPTNMQAHVHSSSHLKKINEDQPKVLKNLHAQLKEIISNSILPCHKNCTPNSASDNKHENTAEDIAAELQTLILTNKCLVCSTNKVQISKGHYKSSVHYNNVRKWIKSKLIKYQLSIENNMKLIFCMPCNLPLEGCQFSKVHYVTKNHLKNAKTFCEICFEVIDNNKTGHLQSKRHRQQLEAILQKIPNHEETQNNFCFDKKKYTPKIPSVTTQQKPAAFQKSPPNKTHAVTVATQTSPKMHNMNQLENSPIPTNTHSFKQTDLTFQQSDQFKEIVNCTPPTVTSPVAVTSPKIPNRSMSQKTTDTTKKTYAVAVQVSTPRKSPVSGQKKNLQIPSKQTTDMSKKSRVVAVVSPSTPPKMAVAGTAPSNVKNLQITPKQPTGTSQKIARILEDLHNMMTPTRCILCQRVVTETFFSHYFSSTHSSHVEKWLQKSAKEKQVEIELHLAFCHACNQVLDGTPQSLEHYKSEDHATNAAKYCVMCRRRTEDTAKHSRRPGHLNVINQKYNVDLGRISYFHSKAFSFICKVKTNLENLITPICRLCEDSETENHRKIPQHVKNVRSWTEVVSKDSKFLSLPKDIVLKSLYCEGCCIVPTEDSLSHYWSKEHKRVNYCSLCIKWLHSNDVKSHNQSKKHIANLEKPNKFGLLPISNEAPVECVVPTYGGQAKINLNSNSSPPGIQSLSSPSSVEHRNKKELKAVSDTLLSNTVSQQGTSANSSIGEVASTSNKKKKVVRKKRSSKTGTIELKNVKKSKNNDDSDDKKLTNSPLSSKVLSIPQNNVIPKDDASLDDANHSEILNEEEITDNAFISTKNTLLKGTPLNSEDLDKINIAQNNVSPFPSISTELKSTHSENGLSSTPLSIKSETPNSKNDNVNETINVDPLILVTKNDTLLTGTVLEHTVSINNSKPVTWTNGRENMDDLFDSSNSENLDEIEVAHENILPPTHLSTELKSSNTKHDEDPAKSMDNVVVVLHKTNPNEITEYGPHRSSAYAKGKLKKVDDIEIKDILPITLSGSVWSIENTEILKHILGTNVRLINESNLYRNIESTASTSLYSNVNITKENDVFQKESKPTYDAPQSTNASADQPDSPNLNKEIKVELTKLVDNIYNSKRIPQDVSLTLIKEINQTFSRNWSKWNVLSWFASKSGCENPHVVENLYKELVRFEAFLKSFNSVRVSLAMIENLNGIIMSGSINQNTYTRFLTVKDLLLKIKNYRETDDVQLTLDSFYCSFYDIKNITPSFAYDCVSKYNKYLNIFIQIYKVLPSNFL